MQSKSIILIFASSLLFLSYCKGSAEFSSSSKNAPPVPDVSGASQYIDASTGGTLQLGANMTLSIPAGALEKSVEITAAQVNNPAQSGGLQPLAAYSFGQHGLEFHRPAILKMCYSASVVQNQGLNEDSMAIYYNDATGYISYGGTVDKTNHCVTTEIHHFSTYFVAAQQLLTINTPPLVGGVSTLPSTPMAGIPLKLRSVVTDFNAGGRGQVAAVWLHYCVGLPSTTCGGSATFQKVAMLPDTTSTITPNRYTYTIPANAVTTAGITYFIEAIDNLRLSNNPVTGTRTITATATGLTISPATLDIAAGFSRQFTVQAVPDSGPARDIDFASVAVGNGIGSASANNQGILVFDATTSGNPLTTGYRTGTVTASVGSLSAAATVNVWPGRLTAIQLLDSTGVVLGANITVAPSSVFDFDARGLDAFGNHSLVYPAWIVTNPLVGSIPNNDGLFTASANDGQSGGVLAIVDSIAGSVTVNIVAPPTVTLGVMNSPFSENGGIATVTAYLSQVYASPVTVNLAFSGTALPGDFLASSNSVIIPAGQLSGDVTLTGVDNAAFEGNKTVVVDIASVVNGIESGVQQVTATIQDDETAPFPISATPVDGSTNNPITTSVSVTFSQAMNPATMTTTTTTACVGSLQLSADDFVTCIAMTSTLAAMSNGNATVTVVPVAPLINNTTYKIRVTTAAQGANGAPLSATVTSPSGWSTEAAPVTNQLIGGAGGGIFGACLGASGNYALVGVGNGHGFYVVYKNIGASWTQVAQIPGYIYGNRNVECAISGAYIAIKTDQSVVTVYKNNGSDVFNPTAILSGFDTTVTGFADAALALAGDTLVIGSTLSEHTGTRAGAAFVFHRNASTEAWDLVQRLDPTILGNPFTHFGSAIATNGTVIAVTGRETGSVDIFEKNSGNIWAHTGNIYAGFQDGEVLAISADGTLVIGAENQAWNFMSNVGVVHIAEKNGFGVWGIVTTLSGSDVASLDAFGSSVAIEGNLLIVGARAESGGAGDYADPLLGRGAIYTFQKGVSGVWQQISKYEQPIGVVADPDGRRQDLLGHAVALSNTTVFGAAINTLNINMPTAATKGTVWIYPAP